MAQAREAISEHETRILENMEAIEGATAVVEEADREIGAARTRHSEQASAIDAREAELVSEIERLRELRGSAGEGIDGELLDRYEGLAESRRPAVVSITDERCSGCLVQIPPQSFIEIMRAEKIVTCGNCSRILVHAQHVESEAAG